MEQENTVPLLMEKDCLNGPMVVLARNIVMQPDLRSKLQTMVAGPVGAILHTPTLPHGRLKHVKYTDIVIAHKSQPIISTVGAAGPIGPKTKCLPQMTDRLKTLLIIDTEIKPKPQPITLDDGLIGQHILKRP